MPGAHAIEVSLDSCGGGLHDACRRPWWEHSRTQPKPQRTVHLRTLFAVDFFAMIFAPAFSARTLRSLGAGTLLSLLLGVAGCSEKSPATAAGGGNGGGRRGGAAGGPAPVYVTQV